MLKTIRVSAMLLALAVSAHAGEILTPPAPPPVSPIQQPTPVPTVVETEEIPPSDTEGSLTEIALSLLAVLPSLL